MKCLKKKCCDALGCRSEIEAYIKQLEAENEDLRTRLNAHRLLGGYSPLPQPKAPGQNNEK